MTTRLAAGAMMTTTTTTAMVTKEGTTALPRQRTLGSERRGGRTKAGQQKKAGQHRQAVAMHDLETTGHLKNFLARSAVPDAGNAEADLAINENLQERLAHLRKPPWRRPRLLRSPHYRWPLDLPKTQDP